MTTCNKDAKSAQVSKHVYMRNQLTLLIMIVGSRASTRTFTLLGTTDKLMMNNIITNMEINGLRVLNHRDHPRMEDMIQT